MTAHQAAENFSRSTKLGIATCPLLTIYCFDGCHQAMLPAQAKSCYICSVVTGSQFDRMVREPSGLHLFGIRIIKPR
jgi:hypothetical protein